VTVSETQSKGIFMKRRPYRFFIHAALAACVAASTLSARAEPASATVEQVIEVAPVWSGHPVRFALLTHPPHQYVAFYDAERQMTVGSRRLDSDAWKLVRLPSRVGWDSHNYLTMALDDGGHLHLAGNMHCVPLVYFRTTAPHDVTTLRRVEAMVGRNERRCTYPRFLHNPEGELVFTYRDGSSGNGDQIWNVYDRGTTTWRRLLDEPLFSGRGKMNAYFVGPVQDGDGVYHVCWVWRDTPDCATNHDLCYARSRDLVEWQTSDGRPLDLPITIDNAEIVDPVPAGGGMINGNTKVGFDTRGRPILSYHKFDAQGKTQLYNARREADGWTIYQTSDWDYRWAFQGGGTIRFEIGLGPVTVEPGGSLIQAYRHAKHGSGRWKLDEKTLQPTGPAPPRPRLPAQLRKLQSDRPGMGVRTASDLGESGEAGARYLLRWETLPSNRDRPRPGDPPPPSMLRLYKLIGG
jgi:hypothetical protein